jgi:CheY-like chemotaxis protein
MFRTQSGSITGKGHQMKVAMMYKQRCGNRAVGLVKARSSAAHAAQRRVRNPRFVPFDAHLGHARTGAEGASDNDLAERASTPERQKGERAPYSIPRVLHVDGDEESRGVLSTLLAPEAQVVHVSTMEEARRLLETSVFSLVVMDPGPNSRESRLLLPFLATTPLLVYSAVRPEWHQGYGHYVPKPWTSTRQLWSTIASLLGLTPGMSAGD